MGLDNLRISWTESDISTLSYRIRTLEHEISMLKIMLDEVKVYLDIKQKEEKNGN